MRVNTILSSPYVDTLQQHAPGVDPSLLDSTIYPSIHAAEKELSNIVGEPTYRSIRQLEDDDPVRREFIAALCNLVMFNYKVWEVIYKRQTQGQDTYKYELELMQSQYTDNYYSHVEDLIKMLEGPEGERFPEWAKSPAHKQISTLLIKDVVEFNACYNIDNSYFFFFSTIFLQRKVLDRHIEPAFNVATLCEGHLRRAKVIVATYTVAYALRQFDFISLPKSIRNAKADGPSRNGANEQDIAIALSDYLFGEANKDLYLLTEEVNRPDGVVDIESTTNLNDPKDKFFLMG